MGNEPGRPAGGINAINSRPDITRAVTQGALKTLIDLGLAPITEFVLPDGLRADIAALGTKGQIIIVEVKSCLQDWQADTKWPGYRQWCDELLFAIPAEFPIAELPIEEGLIIADAYAGERIRTGTQRPLAPARRKSITLRFARAAATKALTAHAAQQNIPPPT